MKSILPALLCLALSAPAALAAEPELMAALSVMGYGYKVQVLVNGADVGVEGGKSEGRRLFNKGHEMAAKAAPAMRAKNFVLVPGANQVTIDYAKLDPKSNDALEVTFEAAGYPQPVLRFTNKGRPTGKVSFTVNVEAKPPADFKPVVVSL
ncbi:MAG TPA: hypothetical protein VK996_16920 [Ramlibacter sp.]|nr:hypothetical protein [Ramlibacter sp.]